MLPLMSEYLFSDLAVAGKTDDALAFCDIKDHFTPTDGWYNFDQNRLVIFLGETYNGIKYANTVISYIDKVEGLDEATKNEYLGRAYFHRSYRYLNLCFQFGDVPFVSKIIEAPKLDYKSTKREAIIKRLVQDMEFAVQHVPEQKDMTYIGMVNKGACRPAGKPFRQRQGRKTFRRNALPYLHLREASRSQFLPNRRRRNAPFRFQTPLYYSK